MQLEEEQRVANEANNEAAAAAKPVSKGKGSKADAKPPGKDEKAPTRAGSALERPSTSGSRDASMTQFLKENATRSCDDDNKTWNFQHFERVVNQMSSTSTSVGSILAAMVYQVEKQNEPVHVFSKVEDS